MTQSALPAETQKQIAALRPGETITVVGRCPEKGCRSHARLDVGGVTLLDDDNVFGNSYSHPRFPETEGRKWIGTGAWLKDVEGYYGPGPRCEEHGERLGFRALRGTFTDKPCDSSCLNAVSAECKCSCGGANHGIACP